ncbi:MAG: hypothetical protein Q9170_001558 [Blastenia crenularia]
MAVPVLQSPSSHLRSTSQTLPSGLEDLCKDGYSIKDTAARRWLDAQQQPGNNQQGDGVDPFFEFEPSIESTSPFVQQYPSLPEADLTPGWDAIQPQMLSPPHSASSPPPSWPPFGYQQPHNILTDIYPDTRTQYGQNTPPDESFDDLFPSTDQPQVPTNGNDEKKRKRQPASNGSKASPTKRSRKYGRSVDSSNGQVPSGAEEVRRSKFLERNRIAASKCRQKKKEWTQNLENRGRELQKEHQSLKMMMESLRDERLFLKNEMLKHTTCGCEQIQGWVKSSAASLATSPIIKTEHSPIHSPPTSRRGSFSSSSGNGYHDEGSTSPHPKAAQRSKSPELQNLEVLLMDQLVHDTSDQGIANMLQAAA